MSTPLVTCVKNYILTVIIRGESYLAWPLWFVYSSTICFYIISKDKINKTVLLGLLLVGISIISIYIF